MADADRTLEVVLKLRADTDAATTQLKGALAGVEAQATSTVEAVNAVQNGGAAPAAGAAQTEAYRAERAAMAASEAEYANAYAAEWSAAHAKVQAAREAAFWKAEEERQAQFAQTEQQIEAELAARQAAAAAVELQMQRRFIMQSQIAAAEARIAGDTALAAKLEREADIRLRSLSIQRTLNTTTAESIVLSERLVLAEEAQAVATGGLVKNAGKARAETLQLTKELIVGGSTTRTLGSLMTTLAPALTIAGLAAFGLVSIIRRQVEETKKLREEFEKVVQELNNASKEWDRFARNAESFTDKVHLAEKIQSELDKMSAEMSVFRAKELPLWQRFWDSIIKIGSHLTDAEAPGVSRMGSVPGDQITKGPNQTAKEKAILEEQNHELDTANDKLER